MNFVTILILFSAVTRFSSGEKPSTCSLNCYNCRTGNGERKLCTQYCSRSMWCGRTRAYKSGGIDCTSCKPIPTNAITKVDCGGHIAERCSECPNHPRGTTEPAWCNGECEWDYSNLVCIKKEDPNNHSFTCL